MKPCSGLKTGKIGVTSADGPDMKHLLLWVILLSSLSLLSAQNLSGGLVLGFNASQVDGDNDGGFRQIGPSVGGFVQYGLGDRLVLQPEIVFEQLGSVAKGGGFGIRTTHISVPILLSTEIPIDFGDGDREVIVQAGPVIGILLGAKDIFTGVDFSPAYRNSDLRAVAGIGLGFSERWSVVGRYGYSIISFLGAGSRPAYLRTGAPGLFHHYVNFSLRYHLG